MSHLAPVWFISHGSPDLVLRRPSACAFLEGMHLEGIRALIVLSAHWYSREPQIGISSGQALMYDFYGFPEPLYQIRWPGHSSRELVERVCAQLGEGVETLIRPFDHGVWSPLSLMDPEGAIPLLQLSLPEGWSPAALWAFGERLAQLRGEGIGILASGSLTHNLGALKWRGGEPDPWASHFIDWLEEKMQSGDHSALQDYRTLAPHAAMAHPVDDHLRPLFIALGAAGGGAPTRLHASWDLGNLYMGSYRWD
ncbi:DODA-type extradiol aromatic ring-opening family dioxygenase [Aeromonas diversa]|uniref:DODA-type extradiol aromatic ring-opening family dioxygenase n=1 Tax=Aeromonas diversa TaxID=502790 RepID=UPI00346208F3